MSKRYEADYSGFVYEKTKTHWTPEELVKKHLRRVDFTKTDPIEAGGIPIISDGKIAYIDDSDAHSAVIAPSGMKKSVCFYMPLIYTTVRAEENPIITDPKGELFDRTAGFVASQGYKVFCLDFRSFERDGFNILAYPAQVYRNVDKDRGLSMLSDIVSGLAEDQRDRAKDPFWPETGVQWCNGTGAMMFDSYPSIDQINIMNWADYCNSESAELVKRLLPLIPDGNTSKTALKETLSAAENTLRSILITASSFLAMFKQNNKMARMLSHSTFDMEELCKKKTALYIITDDTTSTCDAIVGIIISQIQTFLVDKAYHNEGKLETRVNFIMDEFANFAIPNMDKALATHRSRNIRYYLCVQTLAGLRVRYPQPEALLANCGNTIFLGSTESELLEKISTQCGTTHITPNGTEKPLISPAELMTLKKSWEFKEGLYLNLSDSIRYCATLPSIEAYDLGSFDAPPCHCEHPAIDSYTVADFARDLANEKIPAPFSASKKKTLKKCKSSTKGSRDAQLLTETDLEKQIIMKFDQLFDFMESDGD